jgi:hypothetical protein
LDIATWAATGDAAKSNAEINASFFMPEELSWPRLCSGLSRCGRTTATLLCPSMAGDDHPDDDGQRGDEDDR